MSKDCILYLVRTSQEDLNGLNESLTLLELNVLPFCKSEIDIILFHEKTFDKNFQDRVKKPKNANILFSEISFNIPKYPKEILDNIPEFYPHPTHGPGGPYAHTLPEPHKGFTMGYRHMCRFFSGWMYEQEILKTYEYYLRLDTDSFIRSPLKYDIFQWMRNNQCEYGFVEPAVQQDNPKVVINLWNTVKNWLLSNKIKTEIDINQIPDARMFYTNFELGKLSSFIQGSKYFNFYKFIDLTGGIYTGRWGDAPIKFLGVNLFIDQKAIKPIRGFVYEHGAVYSI